MLQSATHQARLVSPWVFRFDYISSKEVFKIMARPNSHEEYYFYPADAEYSYFSSDFTETENSLGNIPRS